MTLQDCNLSCEARVQGNMNLPQYAVNQAVHAAELTGGLLLNYPDLLTVYSTDVVTTQHEASQRWSPWQRLQALYVIAVHVKNGELRQLV
jgi:hypothetical protein